MSATFDLSPVVTQLQRATALLELAQNADQSELEGRWKVTFHSLADQHLDTQHVFEDIMNDLLGEDESTLPDFSPLSLKLFQLQNEAHLVATAKSTVAQENFTPMAARQMEQIQHVQQLIKELEQVNGRTAA